MNASKGAPSNHNSHQNQKPLSNNQLKLLKAREWRRKMKQQTNHGHNHQSPYEAEGINSRNGLHSTHNSTSSNESSSSIHPSPSSIALVKPSSSPGLTRHLAIDCEMVGVGPRGCRDVLARVSIVNAFGHVIYDKYVRPNERVTDYRTFVSGIEAYHLKDGISFEVCQREVCNLLQDRILIGHAVHHDLKVLYLDHPKCDIRDTSKYFDASVYGGKGTPSLRKLTEYYLNLNIQNSSHDSVEDARATMRLYTMFKKDWETSLHRVRSNSRSGYE